MTYETIQDVGLCRDDVEEELQEKADLIEDEFDWAIDEMEVRNELLDGIAHIRIELIGARERAPIEMENLFVEQELVHVTPEIQDGNLLLRMAPERFYNVMAEAMRDSE